MVAFYPIDYTNNYLVISDNDMIMVTINSGLEVDLSGQVCADSLVMKYTAAWAGR